MTRFHILTIFPNIFDSYLNESLFKRAIKRGLVAAHTYDIREFTSDKHHKVDDRPFGGGPGMVMKVEPIYKAVAVILKKRPRARVILFSVRGRKLDAKTVKRLSHCDDLILICGRYEGVDERVAQHIADEEISIGNYVLAGGELPAMILMEAVSRYLPGFLGKEESREDIKGSYPTYTRPEVFAAPGFGRGEKHDSSHGKKWRAPKALLSGDHKKIDEWRRRRGA